MNKVILYHVHPGQKFSQANAAMAKVAQQVEGITFVDLYADYPRHDIDVAREQARLLAHDIIVFQFPLYWYSTPSLLKEWQDLVLQHGFAYGQGGDNLAGKTLALALTAGGSADAYAPDGYQQHTLRTFLAPLEQTAHLCGMAFATPYVLFSALNAPQADDLTRHLDGYRRLLTSFLTDRPAPARRHDDAVLTAADVLTSEKV